MLPLESQVLLDAAAVLAVSGGGQVQVRTETMIAGSVMTASKPGLGKTVALGLLGVVPAVLYRTLGARQSEHGFAFIVTSDGELALLKGTGHGAGLALVDQVVRELEMQFGQFEQVSFSSVDEFWEWLYDTTPSFARTQHELQELLEYAGLDASQLVDGQIDLISNSEWATANIAEIDLESWAPTLCENLKCLGRREAIESLASTSDQPEPLHGEVGDRAPAQRLVDLEELVEGGLISSSEYAEQRQRILDSL